MYLRKHLNRIVPQSEPLPGQVPNYAGGYAFAVDSWTQLRRFLILGSEGPTYYASEREMTMDNLKAVRACLEEDGPRLVREVVEVSLAGRAPKQDSAIAVLAMASLDHKLETRRAVYAALPQVCRTGSHLMSFAAYRKAMGGRGWGSGLMRAVAAWYNEMEAGRMAYQAIKYQQRNGWSQRDVLRLARPKAASEQHNAIFQWVTHGWPDVGEEPHPDEALRQIWAMERAKRAESVSEVARLVREYRLPREAVPTQWLNERAVWEALLEEMPLTAMVRNLATMTRVGLLEPMSGATSRVTEELANAERIRKARVHPIALLSALMTYKAGRGVRGQHTWTPVTEVVDALDSAFYLAFGNVEPTNQRVVLALDVSGSMTGGSVAGVPGLTPRIASAAMALVTAATEPKHTIVAFSHEMVPLTISPKQRLDDVVQEMSGLPFGATDCALPMLWALGQQPVRKEGTYLTDGYRKVRKSIVATDAFVIYTDHETWFGAIHPSEALKQYRRETEIPAKLAVVGMTATQFSIADPEDVGMLDVVGFDSAAPQLIADFVRQSL